MEKNFSNYYIYYKILKESDDITKVKKELIIENKKRVFFDAEKIICKNQILNALYSADKSFEIKKNLAQTWNVEVLLHICGKHQISKTLKLLDISKSTKIILIAQDFPNTSNTEFNEGFPEFNPTLELLKRYGVQNDEDPCKAVIGLSARLITDYE